MATWKEKYNKKYQYKKNKSHNLSDISKDTGVSRSGLQKIYNKGIGAYKTNPQSVRPNVTSKEHGLWLVFILRLWVVRQVK